MKTSLTCLLIALALRLVFDLAHAQDVQVPTDPNLKSSMTFRWLFYSEKRDWLKVYQFDGKDAKRGYDPSYTYLVSDYKPLIKKIGGKWQVTFTSELAEGLP